MNHVLQIVGDLILCALGVVGLIWLFWRSLQRSDDPRKMAFKWCFSIAFTLGCFRLAMALGPFGPFVIVFLAVVLSFMWTPHLGEWLAKPITSLFDGGDEEIEPRPLYSIAKAKRKQGLALEAIVEARKQLAKFPNDHEGVMFVATIQGEDLHDLPSAEITVNHFCVQPGQLPSQVYAALIQLADWHLKLGHDNESARAALQRIIEMFPDSEYSLAASQRIGHLATTEHLLAPLQRKIYAVEHGIEDMGLLKTASNVKPVEIPPEQQAAEFVKHLEQHPLDMEVREKLAMIYAEHYRRLDLATSELEQMIQLPNQPAKLVTHWLNLLADFQIKLAGNYNDAKQTLERLIKMFPNTAASQVAERRIGILKLELNSQKESQAVKLGSYETDIGLKY